MLFAVTALTCVTSVTAVIPVMGDMSDTGDEATTARETAVLDGVRRFSTALADEQQAIFQLY